MRELSWSNEAMQGRGKSPLARQADVISDRLLRASGDLSAIVYVTMLGMHAHEAQQDA